MAVGPTIIVARGKRRERAFGVVCSRSIGVSEERGGSCSLSRNCGVFGGGTLGLRELRVRALGILVGQLEVDKLYLFFSPSLIFVALFYTCL